MNKLELQAAFNLQATVIESLEQQVVERRKELGDMVTELTREKEYTASARADKDELQKAIDAMHACFDEIDGVMPRYKEQEESWMSKVEMPLPARFASYCRSLIK